MSFIKQYISKASIVVAVMFVPVLAFATPDHPAITVNAHIHPYRGYHPTDTVLLVTNGNHVFRASIPPEYNQTFTSTTQPSTSTIEGQSNLAIYVRNGLVACSGGRFTLNRDITISIQLKVTSGGSPYYACSWAPSPA